MISWLNAQLHNHTTHSDGKDTVQQMVDKLSAGGARILAITDHNAVSGIPPFLKYCKEKGIIGIRGNEISSYYGHVVGLGVEDYLDWRYYQIDNPEQLFDDIHAKHGLCGLAHPIRIGYPLVPSCSWLYNIHDYSKIDYFEILNTGDWARSRNDIVIEYWLKKLRAGFLHLGAVSALDYHARPFHGHEYVTYIGIDTSETNLEQAVMSAIKYQRMIICKDKFINIYVLDKNNSIYYPGDTINDNNMELYIELDSDYKLHEKPIIILDDQNKKDIIYDFSGKIKIKEFSKFLVVSVYKNNTDFSNLLAISNPFKK
ncbi:CehA/McbA family metallohydrolase [Treponema sp. HNW]|uniref:CehA/McbA family metallohydrolase n=1 Tax=Treponema sp. HNW TaxID=3116654 RepID=UPI003D109687